MRCAPARLVGGGGRRGPSCDTPPPRILIPASPRYFRLPAPAPFRSLQEGHPRRPPRLRAAHASGRESTSDFACSPPSPRGVPPVSLSALVSPRGRRVSPVPRGVSSPSTAICSPRMAPLLPSVLASSRERLRSPGGRAPRRPAQIRAPPS
ncbi:hypothetical protein PVAP13_1KG348405 [Panicum virgatum]|uniref:Uncharacterized protein n=1 Tax=Panicum virgatum TaxID=38727 RepID=A0A8T0XH77_PANVG|nr:hypothetical protein PVAP13_1KG348405 [Panicum virgatum]